MSAAQNAAATLAHYRGLADEATAPAVLLRHTPGPWLWTDGRLSAAKADPARSAVHTILYDDGGCGYLGSSLDATVAELAADRDLIAAAPDMLAVLLLLRDNAADWSEYEVPLGFVCRINDAIAKATGVAA